MVDVLSPTQRRFNMSRIRSKDTKPELQVRRWLHAEGYRYRVHLRGLPGTPDIAFTARRKAVFVNGCFWHLHSCPSGQVRPATNPDFWVRKREATVARDVRKREELETLGWEVLTVWECELKDLSSLGDQIKMFLGPTLTAPPLTRDRPN